MKKLFLILGVLMSMTIFGANGAEPRVIIINNKPISITDVSLRAKPELVKLHTSNMKNGVYVNVQENLGTSFYQTPFPITNKYVRQILEHKGIKVVEKIEDADMSISFGVESAGMNMVNIEHASPDFSTSGKVIINGGAMMGMAAGGANAYALLGGLVGAFIPHDDRVSIHGTVHLSPGLNKNWINSKVDTDYYYSETIDYRLPEKNEDKVNAVELFTKLIDEWVDTYIVIDSVQSGSGAASAVAAASSMADSKK